MIRRVLALLLSLLAAGVLVVAVMSFSGWFGPVTARFHIEAELQAGNGVLYVNYLKRTEAGWDGDTLTPSLLGGSIRAVGGWEPLEMHALKGGADLVLGRGYRLWVHLWVLFLILAVYPLVFFVRGAYRRYRRRRKGLCIKCGYNLTGNVSGICPECGEKT